MVASLLMTVPLWIADSAWWVDLIANFRRNPQWEQPSAWWLIHSQLSSPVMALGVIGLLLTGSIVLAIEISKKTGPVPGTVWGLALTTVAGKYLWGWNFVLLLPLFIDTAARVRRPEGIIGLVSVWLGAAVFGLLSLQPGPAGPSCGGCRTGSSSGWFSAAAGWGRPEAKSRCAGGSARSWPECRRCGRRRTFLKTPPPAPRPAPPPR